MTRSLEVTLAPSHEVVDEKIDTKTYHLADAAENPVKVTSRFAYKVRTIGDCHVDPFNLFCLAFLVDEHRAN